MTPPIKRKLEGYLVVDDDLVVRRRRMMMMMRKNHHDHLQPRASSSTSIQFFVRTMGEGKSLVLRGNPEDTIELIHQKIQSATGIPVGEQRLIYGGKQLQWEQSLSQCRITNDAGLHLVGRMRSTGHPQVWQVLDDVVSMVCRTCSSEGELGESGGEFIKAKLGEFLDMTPTDDDDEATPYLNIFLSSSVPAALVMLYTSTGNHRPLALDSIHHFIKSLPRPIYSDFAPILLQFCKLLATHYHPHHDDPLYKLCRTTLGSMVLHLKFGRTTAYAAAAAAGTSSYNKVVIAVHEIFPFVNELATKLSQDLASTVGPSPSDVHDFGAFVRPLTNAIAAHHGTPLLPVGNPWYPDEVGRLYIIFLDLLAKLQACLNKVEDHVKVTKHKDKDKERHGGGWDQYLCILKDLHHIALLYQGAQDKFWINFRCNKVSMCYLIVRHAKRGEDYNWILGRKDLTDFESRRHLVMMLLPEVKDEYEELHEMLIDRSQLLAESFEYIAAAEPGALRSGLFMEFKNEEATGPGVLREWFLLVCQAIFNPQNALFLVCPNDRRRFFPNPASKVDPMHLRYLKFAGRVIALALMHKMQVGIVLERSFFLQLGGVDVCLEDIKDADPYLYGSCRQILDMDACAVDEDALGLTFVWEVEELGSMKVLELVPDGKVISVNSRNRKEYVNLLVKHRFVTSVAQQVAEFARGFADIVTSEEIRKLCFKSLVLEDLDGMLHGSESPISVDDWKAHTEYNGYKCTDPQIYWFWKIVGEMTAEQRKALLFFWTSVKYLPVEGFCGLASRLYIYKSGECDRLPSSHTCFFRICFPAYPSMAVMQQRLNIITQQHVACSFGTW